MSITPLLAFLEGPELLIVLAILLVLFGGAKLPQLARSVGSAQREFKKGLSGEEDPKNANVSKSTDTVAKDAQPSDSEKA